MNGSPILLCKNFTYVAGAAGGEIIFDWVGFDASYENATLVLEVKLYDTGTVNAEIQTSTDGSSITDLAGTALNAAGVVTTQITADLLPMVRLGLSSAAAAARLTLTAWLLPKHD